MGVNYLKTKPRTTALSLVTNGETQILRPAMKIKPVEPEDPFRDIEMPIYTHGELSDKHAQRDIGYTAKATTSSLSGKPKTKSSVTKPKKRSVMNEAKTNDNIKTNEMPTNSKKNGKLEVIQDTVMEIQMVPIKIEAESCDEYDERYVVNNGETITRNKNEEFSKTFGKKRGTANTKTTKAKSKKQKKSTSEDEPKKTNRVSKKIPNTINQTESNRIPKSSNKNGEQEGIDNLMDVQMVMDINKPEVESIAHDMVPIKLEDESSDEYDDRYMENYEETTSSSEDEESSTAVGNKRGKATGAKSKTQNKKGKEQLKKVKVKVEPKARKERKWSYYSDSHMSDSPPEPYSDSDSDDWQPKLNVAYVKKIQSAIGKNKPFWFCPDNFYRDD